MPKIPTYTAKGRPTAEVSSAKMNLKLSPTATTAAALLPAAQAIDEYYIKQRNLEDKTEANKKFFEIQNKVEESQDKVKFDFNQDSAINNFNIDYNAIKNQTLSTVKNKRVKKILETKLDIEYPEYLLTVKRNSRDALQAESIANQNSLQEILMSKYYLSDDENKKIDIKKKIINNEIDFSNTWETGKTALDKSINAIESDLFISDVNKDVNNKNYSKALFSLKNIESSKFLDSNKRIELIEKIQNKYNEDLSLKNLDNIFLLDQGPAVIGVGMKNINNKQITKKDLENTANRFALEKNLDGSLKYTTAQVIEKSVANNIKVPLYVETLDAGGNITDTSNKNATLTGLQLYQTYKNQNALQSLTSVSKIGKDDLETYQRLDFSMNVMKQTFDQAFNNELQYKNNPDKFKLLKSDGKAVTTKVAELDFPGVTPFESGPEFENEAYANIIIKNVANNVMIATGSEATALEFAKDYVEQNYRVDDFKQLVPINNTYPEYHDKAIKFYIKDLYESGRINKEQHKEEDIIPVYFTSGSLTSNQGFVLRDKNTGVPITIDVIDPMGDFDEGNYDKARFTYKDIVEKIYPLAKDVRYKNFINEYNIIKKRKSDLDIIASEARGYY